MEAATTQQRPPKKRGKRTNPVLEVIRDRGRCRVIDRGEPCMVEARKGGLFCEKHQGEVRKKKLDPNRCPVIQAGTGHQCERTVHGESGAGCGYCSRHYQSAMRGTMPGKELRRAKFFAADDVAGISFRWLAEPKGLFESVTERLVAPLGLKKTHMWKYLGYVFILRHANREQVAQMLQAKGVLNDMCELGMHNDAEVKKLLKKLGLSLSPGQDEG